MGFPAQVLHRVSSFLSRRRLTPRHSRSQNPESQIPFHTFPVAIIITGMGCLAPYMTTLWGGATLFSLSSPRSLFSVPRSPLSNQTISNPTIQQFLCGCLAPYLTTLWGGATLFSLSSPRSLFPVPRSPLSNQTISNPTIQQFLFGCLAPYLTTLWGGATLFHFPLPVPRSPIKQS